MVGAVVVIDRGVAKSFNSEICLHPRLSRRGGVERVTDLELTKSPKAAPSLLCKPRPGVLSRTNGAGVKGNSRARVVRDGDRGRFGTSYLQVVSINLTAFITLGASLA